MMPVTRTITPTDEPEELQLKKTVFLGYADVAAGGLYATFVSFEDRTPDKREYLMKIRDNFC